MKPIITFDEFAKMDLRIGKILEAIKKEGSEKLLRLSVDFGEEGTRTILSGIQKFYTPEELIGKSLLFIINLEPRKIMDEMSEGMILCTNTEKPIPLTSLEEVTPGSSLR